MIIGYTAGVFDLFHIGHLTLLKNAKALCDKLIVGVTVDELVLYKGKHAMIPFSDRIEIIRNIKCVDAAVPQYDMDKLTMCKKLYLSVTIGMAQRNGRLTKRTLPRLASRLSISPTPMVFHRQKSPKP